MEKIYKVPEHQLNPVIEKLDKLSKKAEKCGMPAFKLMLGNKFQKEDLTANGIKTFTPWVMFTLEAAQPKLNGWSFLATINHTDDGNVVRAMPGTEPDPVWQTVPSKCDHCKWKRKRNDSYIVQNDAGVVKQVGRSCLADFIGHKNPHEVAKYAEFLVAATEACEVAHSTAAHQAAFKAAAGGIRHFDPNLHPMLDLRTYLAKTLQVIREEGWVSKKEAWETGKNSTADRALFRLFEDTEPAPLSDHTIATDAVNWVESLDPEGNDYFKTLVAVAGNGSGAFDHKRIGVVASIAHVYPQVVAKKARAVMLEQSGMSPYLGDKGDTKAFTGTVVMRRHYQGRYGPGVVLKFADEHGRISTAFLKATDVHNLEGFLPHPVKTGTKLWVECVIADHETYQGEKQTKLTKVQLAPEKDDTPTEEAAV
jgi:hypothetical protein